MPRELRKIQKDIGIFTQTGVMLPVGIRAIEGAGATHGESAGLTSISGQMGLLGEIRGAGMLMGTLRESIPLYPEKGKKRKVLGL